MYAFGKFLLFVLYLVFAATDFGSAAKAFSKHNFYLFGFDLTIAIFMLFNMFDAFISVCSM